MESPRAAVWHEPEPGRWRTMNRRASAFRELYFAMAILCVVPVGIGLFDAIPAMTIAGFGLAVALSVGAAWLKYIPLKPRGADEFRLEDPDDLDVCLVDICTVSHQQPNRWDQGATWFEDGRLFFSGLRTSFVIGGEYVLPRDEWKVFDTPEQSSYILLHKGVPLRAAHRSYVTFSPITRIEGGNSFEREVRFKKRLAQFRDEPPTSEGPRQLPPLTL